MALDAVGHTEDKTAGVAADRLRALVDRIERLEEERKALAGDYFLTVKDNQPVLKADIALAFGGDSPLCPMVTTA